MMKKYHPSHRTDPNKIRNIGSIRIAQKVGEQKFKKFFK